GSSYRAATAIGSRDDLEVVAVWIVPVEPASAVVAVDAARLLMRRVSPVRQPTCLDALEDMVELVLAHEEGVVLDRQMLVGADIGQRDVVVELDVPKWAEADRGGAAQHLAEERC